MNFGMGIGVDPEVDDVRVNKSSAAPQRPCRDRLRKAQSAPPTFPAPTATPHLFFPAAQAHHTCIDVATGAAFVRSYLPPETPHILLKAQC